MKCSSAYHADICPSRRRNGDCVSKYPCRHKVEEPKLKTNADHYRSISDEELAKCLAVFVQKREDDATYMQTWLDWLKQPYKEDT